jgi:quercetin dioxygenase-like cupin family protein
LQRICDVLQTPIGALFDHPRNAFVAVEEAPVIEFGAGRLRLVVLTPTNVTDMHVVRLQLAPGASSDGEVLASDRGSAFVHVLRGELDLDLDGEPFQLDPGDSVTFAGRTPHAFRNGSGRERCEALFASTPAP